MDFSSLAQLHHFPELCEALVAGSQCCVLCRRGDCSKGLGQVPSEDLVPTKKSLPSLGDVGRLES